MNWMDGFQFVTSINLPSNTFLIAGSRKSSPNRVCYYINVSYSYISLNKGEISITSLDCQINKMILTIQNIILAVG